MISLVFSCGGRDFFFFLSGAGYPPPPFIFFPTEIQQYRCNILVAMRTNRRGVDNDVSVV